MTNITFGYKSGFLSKMFGTNVSVYLLIPQVSQSAMFARFVETEKHKNNAWQLQKRLDELSAAIDDQVRQHYQDPQLQQLVR